MARATAPPKYERHSSGQARVRFRGETIYLGKYGSPDSRTRYAEVIERWRRENTVKSDLTVDQLALLYVAHAAQHYRKNGRTTSELSCVRVALRPLVRLYGPLRIAQFTPKKLKAVRDEMIRLGYTRPSINVHVGRVRRMFAWAVSEEHLDPAVLTALETVSGLEAGRSDAKERPPVSVVALDRVEAVRTYVSSPVWAMIQLQLRTAARPGEILIMRGCDLNMAARVWEYRPESHKTEHHGKKRLVLVGPRGQEIVRPFLKTDLGAYLFSPRDVVGERQGPRPPGERYSIYSYYHAIQAACERAFGMPEELRRIPRPESKRKKISAAERRRLLDLAAAWRAEHCWHPHQLRHTALTSIRREFDLDAARTVGGHSTLDMAEHYAEKDIDRARAVMLAIG